MSQSSHKTEPRSILLDCDGTRPRYPLLRSRPSSVGHHLLTQQQNSGSTDSGLGFSRIVSFSKRFVAVGPRAATDAIPECRTRARPRIDRKTTRLRCPPNGLIRALAGTSAFHHPFLPSALPSSSATGMTIAMTRGRDDPPPGDGYFRNVMNPERFASARPDRKYAQNQRWPTSTSPLLQCGNHSY